MGVHKLSGKAGIYQIRNKVNEKVYVGSAKNILHRWRCHKVDLKAQRHHCKHLQRAWNKYGRANFEFEVLEFIDVDTFYEVFAEREVFWQKEKKVDNRNFGYNTVLGATPSEIVAENNRNRVWTEEDREAARQRMLGREQTGRGAKGENHFYAREYALISPDGIIYRGKSVTNFAEEMGLLATGLIAVLNGKAHQYKGWRNGYEPSHRGTKFKFVDPDGNIHEGYGISTWCNKNGYCRSGFHKLHIGEIKSWKGWTCPGNGFVDKPRKDSPYYKLRSPEGVIYEGFNPSGFAKEHGLDRGRVHKLVKGQAKSYKGWTLAS